MILFSHRFDFGIFRIFTLHSFNHSGTYKTNDLAYTLGKFLGAYSWPLSMNHKYKLIACFQSCWIRRPQSPTFLFPEIFSKNGKNLIKNYAIIAQMNSELWRTIVNLSQSKKHWSSNSRSSQHTTNQTYCIISLWNNMGNLLLWEFIYPLYLTKLQCWTQQACVLSLYIMNVPVHDFCHGGCQLHMFCRCST